MLCRDSGGSVDDFESVELMIVYAGDIDFSSVLECDSGVVANDAPVGSPIYEGSSRTA